MRLDLTQLRLEEVTKTHLHPSPLAVSFWGVPGWLFGLCSGSGHGSFVETAERSDPVGLCIFLNPGAQHVFLAQGDGKGR